MPMYGFKGTNEKVETNGNDGRKERQYQEPYERLTKVISI